ncbi:MAG: hypothetical protein AB7V50_06530 [Vampirovibrionia bacterium]
MNNMINSRFFTIDEIQASNFKGLENFEADFNNTSVLLLGSEAAGKTNVYLIADLLRKIPSATVTKGKDKGEAMVSITKDKTNYRFCFEFTSDNKHKLTTYVDGEAKPITKARQSYIIEQLIAPTFSIDELINSSGQKQVEIIKKALNINTEKEEAYYKQKFEARRDLKRDLANNPEPKEVAEVYEVSFDELLKEKKAIEDFNAEQDKKQKVIDYYLGISKKLNIAISEPNADGYVEYVATSKNLNKEIIKFITEKIPSLDQPLQRKTLDKVSESIQNAQKTNNEALLYKNYLKQLQAYNELKLKVYKAEEEVKQAREQLLQKMKQVDIPIEGLSFDIQMSDAGTLSTTLMYNGLHFDDSNINTSRKYAIAAKLQMGLFKPGNLGVMHVNASFMSESTLKELATECSRLGLQCLFEITAREDNKPLVVESIL